MDQDYELSSSQVGTRIGIGRRAVLRWSKKMEKEGLAKRTYDGWKFKVGAIKFYREYPEMRGRKKKISA